MYACYSSAQNFLLSSLLSENIDVTAYRIIILPVVLYEHETWSVIWREKHRLRIFEKRMLKRALEPRPTR
jgi:hypothetical protein